MAFAVIMTSANSCAKHEKDQLIGKWRIASVEFQQFKQQAMYDEQQIAMLQDSIKANTDTAQAVPLPAYTGKYPKTRGANETATGHHDCQEPLGIHEQR